MTSTNTGQLLLLLLLLLLLVGGGGGGGGGSVVVVVVVAVVKFQWLGSWRDDFLLTSGTAYVTQYNDYTIHVIFRH